MSTTAFNPVTGAPVRAPRHGRLNRFAAITEVALAFAVVHVAYRALKHFTVFGQWDAQTNFIPGLMRVAFTILVLRLCGRSFAAYGLSTRNWSYQLNLGLACSLLLFGLVHALNTVDYFGGRFDFGWW